MIRKCHNHKLQTTPWHREEEPLNHHETPGRQIKQSNQLSLPHQTHLDVTIVKCLVTTKINVVDTLYAATAVSLNIVDHLACVTNQPNVSTAQVITLQTLSNAHNGRKRRKFSKSNVKTTYHFLMLVNNTSNFTQVKLMQVLLNQVLATNLHKLTTRAHRRTTALWNT